MMQLCCFALGVWEWLPQPQYPMLCTVALHPLQSSPNFSNNLMIPFRVSCFNLWDTHVSTSTSETPSMLQPFLILPDKNQPTVVISDHFLLSYQVLIITVCSLCLCTRNIVLFLTKISIVYSLPPFRRWKQVKMYSKLKTYLPYHKNWRCTLLQ